MAKLDDGDRIEAEMRVYTRIVMDSRSGAILEADSYAYNGPVALCDRALTQQAEQGGKEAALQAADYSGKAANVQANIVPYLEQQLRNPEGFGPFGLSAMETAAQESAAGASGSAQEGAKLRAMRTGNVAGLGATEAASAEGAARAEGSALQDILARNAALKAQQQGEAVTGLEGILGQDIRGQASMAGLVPEDVKAASDAEKFGWLQNLAQGVNIAGSLGAGLKA